MDEGTKQTAARAEMMRKRKPDEKAPGFDVADKIHALLPDWLSARAAVLRKKARLEQLDRDTAPEGNQ